MRRKIIKQGVGSTIYLPIKWVREHNLKAGDELELSQENTRLIIEPPFVNKKAKKISIKLKASKSNRYRSLIGALYRAGYDEINITFLDHSVIAELQKTVNQLYGFEIFDITKKSCTIRSIYKEEINQIRSYFLRSVHTIKTIQSLLLEDLKKNSFTSYNEFFEFRNIVIKQRDLIARTITQQRLLQNDIFPYYTLSYKLWDITRNYDHMYRALTKKKTASKTKAIAYFKKVNAYFSKYFKNYDTDAFLDYHEEYEKLIQEGNKLLHANGNSIVVSYCMQVVLITQACNSLLTTLQFDEKK